MRSAVFVFSLIFILSTTYAHAVAPLIFTAVEGALIRSAGGQFIKVASKKTLSGAIIGTSSFVAHKVADDYCKKNKTKCKDVLGDVADYLFDDTDNSDNLCYYSGKYFKSGDEACAYFFEKANSKNHRGYTFADRYEARDGYCHVYGGTNKFNGNAGATYRCSNKDEVLKKETQKIINHIKENDVDYIINNYGDTINIQQYCSSHSCDELTAEFGNEVMNNKNDYDIDKITVANCEVENKKIKSCKNAKKKNQLELDFGDETENNETEKEENKSDTDIEINKEDDDDSVLCETSDITKEICEYLDWVDDEAEEPEDTKVDVEEHEDIELDEDIINIMKSCPADMQFSIVMLGKSMTFKLSTMPFCLVAKEIRLYLISAGTLSAIFILAGIKRD